MHTRSAWAGLLLLASSLSATVRQPSGVDAFDRARQMRAALEARPVRERTRQDYAQVLALYRGVYHANPASPRASASVEAVAELLGEQGSLFHDQKAALDAVGQYEFLRREYPGSRYGPGALLAEAELYTGELGDRSAAQVVLRAFLREYPQHPLAAQVRAKLRALPRTSTEASSPHPRGRRDAVLAAALASQAAPSPSRNTVSPVQSPSLTAHSAPAPSAARTAGFEEHDLPAATPASAPVSTVVPVQASRSAPAPVPVAAVGPARHGQLSMITGVRHWSTPVYTRVAIDLRDEVRYEASRVPNPDRIFFDLHGARLSPELVGRSTQVTDDGYLKRIRAAQFSGDVVRVVLDVSDVSDYSAFFLPNPSRLIIDIHGRAARPALTAFGAGATPALHAPVTSPAVASPPPEMTRQARAGTSPVAAPTTPAQQTEIAALDKQPNRVKATRQPTTAPVAAQVAAQVSQGDAADETTRPDTPAPAAAPATRKSRRAAGSAPATLVSDAAPAHSAQPTASGERSMVRALGLKIGRIVVDAGHGGHDSGTLGPGGIEEKTVVLDVALRLGRLLKQRLGADVIYTRDNDTFIPLETRTAIANKAQADLFISVHANSSQDSSARGVETYYLNFTTSADALEVAARENAVSDQSIHQLSDLVRKITLQDKIAESREFAGDVEQSLYSGLEAGNVGLKDRGVKKAPFVVLIGANMPSILAEISFLTNPDDAHQLSDPEYRQRIAESLFRGVARYVGSLSGVRLASAAGHPSGE